MRVCAGIWCTIQRALSDQAVAAFLLDARQAGQELVGDVLAEAFLAEGAARDVEPLGALAASCPLASK